VLRKLRFDTLVLISRRENFAATGDKKNRTRLTSHREREQ
jgi:hypothetical protein